MHLKIYFVDFTRWLVMPYTISPNYLMWSLKNGPTIWLWKFDDQGCFKLLDGVSKPIWFHPIRGNDVSKLIEEKEFINSGILEYLEFWKLNIIIYEVYPKAIRFYIEYWKGISKLLSFWRAFGHLAIGKLIVRDFLFKLHKSLRIRKIWLFLLWPQKIWNLPWGHQLTFILEIYTMKILFIHRHCPIPKCTQYGREECIIMLSRMWTISIIKWCMFNGGCTWREEHTMMQSCTKTFDKEGGNATQ
jgi:hypothetical protein